MADAMTGWAAYVATADLSQRVDVTALLSRFAGVSRHLAGGEWEAEFPASVWSRIVSIWPGQDGDPLLFALRHQDVSDGMILSGPVQSATIERDPSGVEMVTLAGVDEWAAVMDSRVVYPQPADNPPWTTDAYYSQTGQASAVVAALISANAGLSARIERQIALSVIDEGGGAAGTWRYRLAALGDAVADLAKQADLSVDVRRALNGALTVTVGAVRQRPNVIVNEQKLSTYSVSMTMPTATTVIAGGAGEGTARLFAMAGAEVEGGARREAFSDQRNIATQPTLQESANANRSAGSASTSLTGTLNDATAVQWRQHYDLGDTITLSVEGTRWEVPVTAVTVVVDENGLRVSPVLGSASRFALTQLLRDVAGLGARLSSLEVS